MSSGHCDRCGDASGERHLCVPPFLDRGAVTYNASTPPQSLTPDASMSALEGAIPAPSYADYWEWEHTGRPPAALMDVLRPPVPHITHETRAAHIARLEVEIVRLRALIARYADVIGEDADDILPGVPF
jgi:hypothetical protein